MSLRAARRAPARARARGIRNRARRAPAAPQAASLPDAPRPLWLLPEPAPLGHVARSGAVGAARRARAHRVGLVGRRRRAPRLLRRRKAARRSARGSIAITATASTTANGGCTAGSREQRVPVARGLRTHRPIRYQPTVIDDIRTIVHASPFPHRRPPSRSPPSWSRCRRQPRRTRRRCRPITTVERDPSTTQWYPRPLSARGLHERRDAVRAQQRARDHDRRRRQPPPRARRPSAARSTTRRAARSTSTRPRR